MLLVNDKIINEIFFENLLYVVILYSTITEDYYQTLHQKAKFSTH